MGLKHHGTTDCLILPRWILYGVCAAAGRALFVSCACAVNPSAAVAASVLRAERRERIGDFMIGRILRGADRYTENPRGAANSRGGRPPLCRSGHIWNDRRISGRDARGPKRTCFDYSAGV